MKWSGPKLPPGVSATPKHRKDGTVTWYFYYKPTKTRLYEQPGSAAMEREVARASRVTLVVERVTLSDLCDLFEKSPEHKNTAATTRQQRETFFKTIRERWGTYEARHLSDRRFRGEIIDWRNELSDTPAKADKAVRAIQRLLSWAYDCTKIDYDHSKGIKALSDDKPREDKGITVAHERALLACALPHERELYLFALYTTIRQSDLALVSWHHMDDDGWITWRHSKTKKSTGAISFYPVFALPALEGLIDDLSPCTTYMLTTDKAHPWCASTIRAVWVRWKIRAGLKAEDIHFHDIRREGINRLLKAGCTEAEVASISGHAIGDGSALGVYADRSRELALSAYRKLAASMAPAPEGGKIVRLPSAKKTASN